MKILVVCGSRDWTNARLIGQELDRRKPDLVFHGGCRGADLIADKCAKKRGIHTARVDAIWDFYGNPAGPKRNEVIAFLVCDFARHEVSAVAFHNDIANSKGTKDMHVQLQSQWIQCDVISDRPRNSEREKQ